MSNATEQIKPRRVQRRRVKGWRMSENTVYVGRQRGSPNWGNPFRVGRDGSAAECMEKFAAMWAKVDPATARIMLTSLRGKNLACWCKEGEACHADILLELANQ